MLTVSDGAKEASMPEDEFLALMNEADTEEDKEPDEQVR